MEEFFKGKNLLYLLAGIGLPPVVALLFRMNNMLENQELLIFLATVILGIVLVFIGRKKSEFLKYMGYGMVITWPMLGLIFFLLAAILLPGSNLSIFPN